MVSAPSRTWTWIVISCAVILALTFGGIGTYYIATSDLGARVWWVLLRLVALLYVCYLVIRDRLRLVSGKSPQQQAGKTKHPRLPPLV